MINKQTTKITNPLDKNCDIVEIETYGLNSKQQHQIHETLEYLEIETRKRQNIDYINIDVQIHYKDEE